MYNNLQIQRHIRNSKYQSKPQRVYISEDQQSSGQHSMMELSIPTSFFIVVLIIMLCITALSFADQSASTVGAVRGADFSEVWDYQVCIIVQNTRESNHSFIALVQSLQKQTFKDWKAYYYINASSQQQKYRNQYIKSLSINDRFTILPTYPNAGMNYFDGFNNQCETHSLAIILDEGQMFYSQTSLYQIRKLFLLNDHIYILGAGVEVKGSVYYPNTLEIQNFQRFKYFIPNKTAISTAQQIFVNISTHVKAFKVHFYKDIMPFDLMNVYQQFYTSKAAFLFPLLQMRTGCHLTCYFADTSYSTTDQANARMPNIIKITQQMYFISTNDLPKLDQGTVQVYKKQAYQSLSHKYSLADRWMLDKPKIIGQNIQKGELNLLKRNFTKQKKLIPKNINQFWLNYGQLPEFKKKLTQIVKRKHEGYFYKLWTLKDLTKQNFPLTYDTLSKLLNLDKRYGYTRMSMIADLMRLQVLYHHGGFHCDLNYEVFKSYDEFRHFPLLMQTQEPFFTPDSFSMGLFGAEKGSEYIAKLLTPKSLAQINLKGLANIQTGPRFFANVISAQDFYLRVKVIPAQLGNVYIPWISDVRFHDCKCRFEQIPEKLQGNYSDVIQFEGGITVLPCESMYPNTYGMDHFYTGGSWSKKKLINSIIV